ncbi:MAG: Holliday junction resolvase RuvX [Bacteroidetes bacterium HGW-Bacteroidetes-17]|nr:MAG: Holliday junction resolvase RuvX [Bacteroidetes bacterium HGW-Bacteroidetes-17]
MGRILAIDYGRKRVGLAVTDEFQIIANALTTVSANELLAYLHNYISKEKVDCIVIGEPKQMNYEPSESTKYIEPFIRKLKIDFPNIKIERHDERFTSKMAQQTIINAGLKKKDRQNKSLLDSVSATIILQSYMNSI